MSSSVIASSRNSLRGLVCCSHSMTPTLCNQEQGQGQGQGGQNAYTYLSMCSMPNTVYKTHILGTVLHAHVYLCTHIHTYVRRFHFSIHRIEENHTSVSLGWPCRCAAWVLVGSRQGPPSGSGSWCQRVARFSGPIGGPHHPSLGRGAPTRHHLGWWYALVSALSWGPGSGSGNKANRGRRKAKRTKPTYVHYHI